ncbi:MAG: RiPP maturation radical SAM C-methyltransferase [Deltaproteobacteria bacterium]|nr:RiPP maturation radical SAM C-methyltransferase [Deltaproteobacteria bacterium]
MKDNPNGSLESIALISAPWPLYNRPSIQIGVLKAHLRTQFPDLTVAVHHVYLAVAKSIGYKKYQNISERTWLAETVYAALLYPERFETIEKLFHREADGNSHIQKVDFRGLTGQIKEISDEFIREEDWGTFGLAGFSASLCQLTASLYFIRQIKKRFPDLLIVVGGTLFTRYTSRNLFDVFPEIDIAVIGEGELPLSRLVHFLKNPRNRGKAASIPGIVTRDSKGAGVSADFGQMTDLTGLTAPDYDDYFDLLKTFTPEKRFFPTLPVEVSRGCWWRKTHEDGKYRGCAFCNLNLQWDGYRSKKPAQVVSEIEQLTTKYRILSVAFMDNLLPRKASQVIFKQLGGMDKDLRMFGEIRATTPPSELVALRDAGMKEVQIGIEALSTRLLGKMNKGTTAIENLEIMKNCEALGITNSSNLMLWFPGSDFRDVEETLRNLVFAMPFKPLKTVRFWLGLGSPVWENPRHFNIRAVFNHPGYGKLFPKTVFNSFQFVVQAYRGDLTHQRKLWRPVEIKIRAWEKAYAELQSAPGCSPILSFRDGREFLIIHQRRFGADPITHRLEGTSRSIYLLCQRHRSTERIVKQFPAMAEDRILPFLRMMKDKKLMFEENEKFLSLAVPVASKK